MHPGAVALSRLGRSTVGAVASAVVITAVLVAGAYGEAHPSSPADRVLSGHPVPPTPTAALILVAVAGLVLAGRREWPLPVLVISTLAVVTYGALGYVNGAALLAPTIALYAVASRAPTRQAVGWSAATLVALMAAEAPVNPFGTTGGGFYLIPFLVAAAGLGGIAVANRHAYVESMAARAAADAQRRVDDERLRIARELHDVVAHTMATIYVQAGVAGHLLADPPENPATQALSTIKEISRHGLQELRAILNVLRQADEREPTEPAPRLAQLDTLINTAIQAGLPTTVITHGEPGVLPSAVDLAAYRIIQEALTNTIRHAGPASVTVRLDYGSNALRIEITDTGVGPVAGGRAAGHGLIGMNERATAVGGTMQAGPGDCRGFRVRAELPLAGASSTTRPPLVSGAR